MININRKQFTNYEMTKNNSIESIIIGLTEWCNSKYTL